MGELAGFCVPALVGGLLREAPPLLVLGAMVLAGSVEGAILGWSQSRVLRRRLLGFNEARWVGATAVAAAAAWFVGMLPSTFHEQWSTWPTLLTVLVAIPWAALLLTSIGLGQWRELRRHVPRAARWVLITAAGWGAGLIVFTAVATPLWQPGQDTALIVAIGIGAGGLMAVTMALLTGWGMRHLIHPSRRPGGRHLVRRPWRRTFVAVEGLVAVAGAAGTVQLLAGIATPPDATLDPLASFGVSGWELPALWLFASVAVPSAMAAGAALHGSSRTPRWVMVASGLLAVELLVQVPFLGFNVMQAVFGAVAVVMAALAWRARAGWRPVRDVPREIRRDVRDVREVAAAGQRPEGSRSELVSLGGVTKR